MQLKLLQRPILEGCRKSLSFHRKHKVSFVMEIYFTHYYIVYWYFKSCTFLHFFGLHRVYDILRMQFKTFYFRLYVVLPKLLHPLAKIAGKSVISRPNNRRRRNCFPILHLTVPFIFVKQHSLSTLEPPPFFYWLLREWMTAEYTQEKKYVQYLLDKSMALADFIKITLRSPTLNSPVFLFSHPRCCCPTLCDQITIPERLRWRPL